MFPPGRTLAARAPQREPSAALSSGYIQGLELPELKESLELLLMVPDVLKVLPEMLLAEELPPNPQIFDKSKEHPVEESM